MAGTITRQSTYSNINDIFQGKLLQDLSEGVIPHHEYIQISRGLTNIFGYLDEKAEQ